MFLTKTSPTTNIRNNNWFMVLSYRSYIHLSQKYFADDNATFQKSSTQSGQKWKTGFLAQDGAPSSKSKALQVQKATLLYYCMLYSTCKMCKLYSNSLNTENVKAAFLSKI